MKVGFIGLGKMGARMVGKLLSEGHEVIVWNRSKGAVEEFKSSTFAKASADKQNSKLKIAGTIRDLVRQLEKPRIVWIMVPHVAVEEVLTEVRKFVEPGDIVIDGGNSFYKDTERRFKEFEKSGVRFLGIGVSGGILAFENGYPMMVGGSRLGYEHIRPVLDSLSKPNGGHEYFGTGGAGHFVKMAHNGIEYPIMQALGEGFGVLANSSYNFDLLKIAKLYQKGTLVSGFMLDRAAEALENDPKLSHIAGVIGSASEEAFWTVEEANRLGQPVESIEQAIDFRKRSKTEEKVQNSFAAKLVGALRIAFGGHPVRQAPSKGGQAG